MLALALAGCAPPPPAIVSTPEALEKARGELARLRSALVVDRPRGTKVQATLRDPTGRAVDARGALAVRPGAARLQLVGPAGGLALDVWVDGARGRMAVPAIDRVETEDAEHPRPGRPMAFLRFWLLHPLEGELVAADASRFVLRAPDGASVTVEPDGPDAVTVTRERGDEREQVVARGLACGTTTYTSRRSGVEVVIRCEGPTEGEPSPRAFEAPP